MKYFTFILFLLSAVILNAQMSMEEVSYIPSPSGYYNNLIVKGNADINELVTRSFDVQSYASFLNLETTSSKIFINNLSISTGTVALFSEYAISDIMPDPLTGAKGTTSPIKITMHGGNLSVDRSQTGSSTNLNISDLSFADEIQGKTPELKARTSNMVFDYSLANNNSFFVKNLYILGMKVPSCPRGYYWQDVRIGDGNQVYTILACNTTLCQYPYTEEQCYQQNKCYSTSTCSCYTCQNANPGVEDD